MNAHQKIMKPIYYPAMNTDIETKRKYIMGGFVLPLRRECPTIGVGNGTNVVDAKGRIVKHFKSITLADHFVEVSNQ